MNEREYIAGTIAVDGLRVGHTRHEVEILEDFLLKRKPLHFVEVGIHEGGLSYLLIPILSIIDCNYTGIEVWAEVVNHRVKLMYSHYRATLLLMDCFDPYVFQYVSDCSPKVLYCDGGNKAKEIAHFKDACNPGDIIMCHDFYGFDRVPKEIPEYADLLHEVVEKDIQVYENDATFKRLSERIFCQTRIIGWRKI